MIRIFVEVPTFTKKWISMGFTDDDLVELQNILLNDPGTGNIMEGTGGLRKMRFAFKGKGKSGSARVCYVDFAAFEKIYLLQVFSKDEKANLSKEEKNSVKKMIGILREEASKDWRHTK
ncbi:MAG: type II toxin-antitoxin system RelE/ParE family toxin [Lachnospiraceae bacterium]|jgi:hypothetical protein|nr:type II toxin-antitoxin system RelE/ParE family toxin [Clostridiales bacterium]